MSKQPKARILLDEMLSPVIAQQLRERSHDVLAVAEDPQLRAMTDPELLAWASEHGRRIVTENVRDFRPLIIDDPSGAGVLFTSSRTFPRTKNGTGKLIAAIDAWITSALPIQQPAEVWLAPAVD